MDIWFKLTVETSRDYAHVKLYPMKMVAGKSWDSPDAYEHVGRYDYQEMPLDLDGFAISNQLHRESPSLEVKDYAWDSGFRGTDATLSNMGILDRQTKTLKAVGRALAKAYDENGEADSYPAYALRVLKALKVKGLIHVGRHGDVIQETKGVDIMGALRGALAKAAEPLTPQALF